MVEPGSRGQHADNSFWWGYAAQQKKATDSPSASNEGKKHPHYFYGKSSEGTEKKEAEDFAKENLFIRERNIVVGVSYRKKQLGGVVQWGKNLTEGS